MTPSLDHEGSSDNNTADANEKINADSDGSKTTVGHNADHPRSDEAVIFTDLEQDEVEDEVEDGYRPVRETGSGRQQLQGDFRRNDYEEGEDGRVWGGDVATYGEINGVLQDDGRYEEEEGWWPGSGGAVATVKLVLEGNLGVITKAWPLHQSLRLLRTELSNATQVPAQFLELTLRGCVLEEGSNLRDSGVEANETVQVAVSSKRPRSNPLTLIAPITSPIPTPDVITVIVTDGDGGEREVVVEVEWSSFKKPWLGGFKHRISGIHFHNAACQTFPPPKTRPTQVTRGTQTVKTRSCSTQTNRNASTQTTYFHPMILSPESTFIVPMEYSSSFRYDIERVLLLQRMVRGWLARRKVKKLRKERPQPQTKPTDGSDMSSSTSESSRLSTDQSSSQPQKGWRGAVPMAELYSRLENWRKKQVSQINATLSGKARRRALVALLDKETELLRSLEAHRSLHSARRRNAAITRFLEEVSRAQVWEVGGETRGEVEVETPETRPVRDLAALATALQQDASIQVRLSQLNALAATVEHFHPTRGDAAGSRRTGQELVSLARRGTHLLVRGTTDARLKGLRKRLHTLIISYLHQVQGREISSIVAPRTIRAAGGKPVLAHGRE
ncbi:IQ motif and ubiquitin-like domain-containing protein [Palaemon carinicauda]|uniref:IQ motif and ubiquitin-like domain-containing protein n=1 Tax=Palaemon carinicauda TaxID=392227 RepID=UPI0035B68F72